MGTGMKVVGAITSPSNFFSTLFFYSEYINEINILNNIVASFAPSQKYFPFFNFPFPFFSFNY